MSERFSIALSGDLTHAACFLVAQWPNVPTLPELEITDHEILMWIDPKNGAKADLERTLADAITRGGELEKSARAFLREVERRAPRDSS